MTAKDFYQSREWISIRYQVLKRYGAICQCCGHTWSRDNPIQVDHIRSRHLNPELALDITNLQILCKSCNKGKGYLDATDWRAREKEFKQFEKIMKQEKGFDKALKTGKSTKELIDVLNKINDPKMFAEWDELRVLLEEQWLIKLKNELWKRKRLAALKNELASRRMPKVVKRDLFQ
jgi:hypothetical protein